MHDLAPRPPPRQRRPCDALLARRRRRVNPFRCPHGLRRLRRAGPAPRRYIQPRGRQCCRVYYSCDTKLRKWVPAPVYALLSKTAVKQEIRYASQTPPRLLPPPGGPSRTPDASPVIGDYLGQQRGGERVGEAAPAAGGGRAARAGRRDALGEGCVGARAAQGQGGAVEAASAAVGAADQPHRAGPRRPSATPLAVLRSGSGGSADGEAHREHARPTADPPPVRVGLA